VTDTALELEEEAGEDLGLSLAMPPVYLLRTVDRCPACRKIIHVYALGCTAFHDAEEGDTIREFHFLTFVRSVPEELRALLKQKCPGYFMDKDDDADGAYLMNHCACGARLDDDFLHGDVGAAFSPETPEGFGHITLFRLPIDASIPVQCSYVLGGGEYLKFAEAQAS
jgi:hypothetical protein